MNPPEDSDDEEEIEGALPVDEIDPDDPDHVNMANVRALIARAKKSAKGNLKAAKLAADTGRLKAKLG